MNSFELAIVGYFSEETDVPVQSLKATIDGDEVIICAVKWLDDGWIEIMDLVDAMNGKWISAGKSSRWVFPVSRIKERLEYEREEAEG